MTGVSTAPPLRVALFGFGVVGEGVYQRLVRDPRFAVVGVACRDPERHVRRGAPAALFTRDPRAFADYDVLVEAVGGVAPAREVVLAALARGADVVTANKTLVARRFEELHEASAKARRRLLYSAAVGGGVPMLETVDAAAREGAISRIEAVVNGTTNFVLDRIGAGLSRDEAVRLAQEAGFAEADPSADIDGLDAAEKISLLARRAFGVGVDPDSVERDALGSVSEAEIVAAASSGAPYKQVAAAYRKAAGVALAVRLVRAPATSPLARPRREENVLVIEREFGQPIILHGKGAGRDPTADSVVADLDVVAKERALERFAAPA